MFSYFMEAPGCYSLPITGYRACPIGTAARKLDGCQGHEMQIIGVEECKNTGGACKTCYLF